ncbi:MAG: helix-turn-helix transcriptional regulator [Bacteroidia bacterium]|nr:helix-turn-helix transcriptional regulator [Bacteroidia bacterium]MCZ2249961.1 helix-turn-helix domain-containing protein [Bacteroidia bacterium]
MVEFKEKITEILKQLNYSFDELAEHLGMSSDQLNQAINDKKVELRTLEFISKELRIPLYSFFRNDKFVPVSTSPEAPFYVSEINNNEMDNLKNENLQLKKEIEVLKQALINCESKIKQYL